MKVFYEKITGLPYFHCENGVSIEQIEKSESCLNLSFSNEYKKYLEYFGVVSVDGHELTGICKSKRLNVVDATNEYREYFKQVSELWYVIEVTNIDNIVIWQDKAGKIYQVQPASKPKKIADSLLDYLIKY